MFLRQEETLFVIPGLAESEKKGPTPPQQESRNMSGLVSGICGFVIVK